MPKSGQVEEIPDTESATGESHIDRLSERSQERFEARRQILSFGEYFDDVTKNPRLHTRGRRSLPARHVRFLWHPRGAGHRVHDAALQPVRRALVQRRVARLRSGAGAKRGIS